MARWKWTDKFLGKEEVFIDDETDNEYAEDEYVEPPVRSTPATDARRKTGVISGGNVASLEMKIIKPEKYDEVFGIAEHLLERRTVVLNLEGVGKEDSRRILDFLSGTTFAIGGQMSRAANFTYIISPKNVDVSADVEGSRPQKEFF